MTTFFFFWKGTAFLQTPDPPLLSAFLWDVSNQVVLISYPARCGGEVVVVTVEGVNAPQDETEV